MSHTRLSIDIAGLKQMIWNKDDGTQYEELPKERDSRYAIRCIDTLAMPVDCMTKRMKGDVLVRTFAGKLDLRPTPESVLVKLRKSKFRKQKAEQEYAAKGPVNDCSQQRYP